MPSPDEKPRPCAKCGGSGRWGAGLASSPWINNICFECSGDGEAPPNPVQWSEGRPHQHSRPSSDPAYLARIDLLSNFGMQFGNQTFALLEKLRDREYDRYVKAVASIESGRAADVARALEVWWDQQYVDLGPPRNVS